MTEEEEMQEEDEQRIKLSLKILLIGDSQVGKTSILLNYTEHIFPEDHISTIGVEYKDKFIKRDNYNIRLQIWDTAGQERFHSITKSIYRNANGVLFIYDITNKESFNNIKNWIKDLDNIKSDDIKSIIIGNKIDLEDKRIINKSDLENLANKYKMSFLEVSAKNNININEAFDLMVNEILKEKDENTIIKSFSRKTKSDLSISTEKQEVNKKKSKCC